MEAVDYVEMYVVTVVPDRAHAACIKIHAYIVYKARPALHPIFSPVALPCLLPAHLHLASAPPART